MKINPVRIEIEDTWRFGLVAFLVDRDDFLKDIEQARQELKITKLLDRSKIEKEQSLRNEKATVKKYGRSPANGIILYVSTKYDDIALKLQKKYHKSDKFRNIIKFAILSGVVLDKDLEKTDPLVYMANPKDQSSEMFIRYPQIAIIIDPETHPKEIQVAIRRFRKSVKLLPSYLNMEWLLPDTITNIKRDREWYWLNKDGMSAIKIWEKFTQEKRFFGDTKTVEAALTQYKSHLNTPLV